LGWWLPKYQTFLLELLAAGLIVGTLYGGISMKFRLFAAKLPDIRFVAAAGFVLMAFAFWFWKAPTPRFGGGVFILLFPVLFLVFHGKCIELPVSCQTFLRAVVITGVIVFSCRIGAPWKLISADTLFTFVMPDVGTPAVVKDYVYGMRPAKGDQCWLVPECSPAWDRPPRSSCFGYSVFYSHESSINQSVRE
jgi:hypothetical protein